MAASTLGELLGPADEEAEAEVRRLLATRYNAVRPFLSLLGESWALRPASGSQRVLAAVKKLTALARRKAKVKPLLPRQSGVPHGGEPQDDATVLFGEWLSTTPMLSGRPPA